MSEAQRNAPFVLSPIEGRYDFFYRHIRGPILVHHMKNKAEPLEITTPPLLLAEANMQGCIQEFRDQAQALMREHDINFPISVIVPESGAPKNKRFQFQLRPHKKEALNDGHA